MCGLYKITMFTFYVLYKIVCDIVPSVLSLLIQEKEEEINDLQTKIIEQVHNALHKAHKHMRVINHLSYYIFAITFNKGGIIYYNIKCNDEVDIQILCKT
jgi:hypothetical protein